MSSRVIIKTLKFCVNNIDEIKYALRVLNMDCCEECGRLTVGHYQISNANQSCYMRIRDVDREGFKLFDTINKKAAELSSLLTRQKIEQNQREQEEARQNEEMYRVRQLKRQEETLQYEQKQLELEQQSFVDAKKQAIITKAKEMGYSIQETQENGKIKLKLVKRIY